MKYQNYVMLIDGSVHKIGLTKQGVYTRRKQHMRNYKTKDIEILWSSLPMSESAAENNERRMRKAYLEQGWIKVSRDRFKPVDQSYIDFVYRKEKLRNVCLLASPSPL